MNGWQLINASRLDAGQSPPSMHIFTSQVLRLHPLGRDGITVARQSMQASGLLAAERVTLCIIPWYTSPLDIARRA